MKLESLVVNNAYIKSTTVTLLDTGNLVLQSAEGRTLWQSFDYPTNTWVPGMKLGWFGLKTRKPHQRRLTSWITDENPYPGAFTLGVDPNNTKQLVVLRRGNVYWQSGVWNGNNFPFQFITLKYFSYFVMNKNVGKNSSYFMVMYANGEISGLDQQIKCDDEYGGSLNEECVRPNQTICGADLFNSTTGVIEGAWEQILFNNTIGISDCKDMCVANCSCNAYATALPDGTGCKLSSSSAYLYVSNGDALHISLGGNSDTVDADRNPKFVTGQSSVPTNPAEHDLEPVAFIATPSGSPTVSPPGSPSHQLSPPTHMADEDNSAAYFAMIGKKPQKPKRGRLIKVSEAGASTTSSPAKGASSSAAKAPSSSAPVDLPRSPPRAAHKRASSPTSTDPQAKRQRPAEPSSILLGGDSAADWIGPAVVPRDRQFLAAITPAALQDRAYHAAYEATATILALAKGVEEAAQLREKAKDSEAAQEKALQTLKGKLAAAEKATKTAKAAEKATLDKLETEKKVAASAAVSEYEASDAFRSATKAYVAAHCVAEMVEDWLRSTEDGKARIVREGKKAFHWGRKGERDAIYQ